MSGYEINVVEVGASRGERVIELYGEFDLHALYELTETLRQSAGPRQAASVDLSGVTFADLCTLRALSELVVSPGLSLRSPSWQVLHGARACGLEERLGFEPAHAGLSRKAS